MQKQTANLCSPQFPGRGQQDVLPGRQFFWPILGTGGTTNGDSYINIGNINFKVYREIFIYTLHSYEDIDKPCQLNIIEP